MAPRSARFNLSAPDGEPRRPAGFVRLRCESLEDRLAPALFNVQAPLLFTGARNFGCVVAGDLNKDGRQDAVLADFGTGYGELDQFGNPTVPGTQIFVLRGNASGGFDKLALTTGGENVSFVTLADINGDGWDDVVAVNSNRQNASAACRCSRTTPRPACR